MQGSFEGREEFQKQIAHNGQYYFSLKANNNEKIGRSVTYVTEAAMKKGVKAVMEVGE